jgi:hypothetical protein
MVPRAVDAPTPQAAACHCGSAFALRCPCVHPIVRLDGAVVCDFRMRNKRQLDRAIPMLVRAGPLVVFDRGAVEGQRLHQPRDYEVREARVGSIIRTHRRTLSVLDQCVRHDSPVSLSAAEPHVRNPQYLPPIARPSHNCELGQLRLTRSLDRCRCQARWVRHSIVSSRTQQEQHALRSVAEDQLVPLPGELALCLEVIVKVVRRELSIGC